jgi:hypothetical protein
MIFIVLFCNVLLAQNIAINEVVGSNNTLITDEDGDYEDFIELYNYDTVAINLENFGITDDDSDPFQWVFPNVILQPNEYLLVWASKKDRIDATQPLHTNFKISAGGETITLTHSNGTILNQSPAISLTADTSIGRLPNGTGSFLVFQNPTPNLSNVSETAPVDAPTFSHASGFYSTNISLDINHQDPNVTIIYTTDGSEPDIDNVSGTNYQYKNIYPSGPFLTNSFQSSIYSSTLTLQDRTTEPNKLAEISTTRSSTVPSYFPNTLIRKSNVIRAKAYLNGVASPTVSATYFISATNSFNHDLPVVSLMVNENELFDYNNGIYVAGIDNLNSEGENKCGYYNWNRTDEIEGNFQYFENQQNILNQNIGVRIHGGCSRTIPFKSFRLYARSEYDEQNTFNHTFFDNYDFNSFKRIVLRNSGNDSYSTLFRDAFMQKLVAHLNFETQQYKPAVVYLNGEYFSILNIRERYDKHFLERKYGLEEDEIDMLEKDGRDNLNVSIGDNLHWKSLYNFIETNDLALDNNFEHVKTLIDEQNFMDYQISQIFINNTDWPHNNIKFFRKNTSSFEENAPYGQDGRWRWLFYDSDFGFGLAGGVNSFEYNALSRAILHSDTDRTWSTLFLNKLIQNSVFKIEFINRYADLLNTTFLPDRAIGLINEMKDVISNEIPNHQTRWSTPSDWESKVDVMIDFANQRPTFARQHIREQFNIDENVTLSVNVSHEEHGFVKVNTIDINDTTPGILTNPYPWSGIYFHNIPITLTAKSKSGYQFSHWSGADSSTSETITITPTEDFSITANYLPITDLSEQLVYYWLFDSDLENDTPFTTLTSTYSTQESNAVINFESAMIGYPFDSSHANWRKSSMERKSEETALNYDANANNNIAYEDASMKGIQIKQPFNVAGNENIMNFQFSTENYENIKVSFAVLDDEGAANSLIVEYLDDSSNWVSTGLVTPTHSISSNYELVTLDFTNIETASNNPDFQYRIRFNGTDMTADDGERVIFNNIAVKGTPIEGTITDVTEGSLTPEFSQVAAICNGETFSPLPTVSENGISGSWSPAIDSTQTTTYTFSPDSSLATETTMVLSVYTSGIELTPIFSQAQPICKGGSFSQLPTVSENGISGTWFPEINNTQTTKYTFTPNTAQCIIAESTTMLVEVDSSCGVNYSFVNVKQGGLIYVSPESFLYIDKDLTVETGGDVIVDSDATKSGSLLVTDTTTGTITYKRNVNDTDWHLIAAPVAYQNVGTFVTDGANAINTSPTTGNYAVAYYNSINESGKKWTYHNLMPDDTNEETLTNFVNGKGYSLNRTASGIFTFNGTMVNTDVVTASVNADNTSWNGIGNPSSDDYNGDYWSSIGNPFPSHLAGNNAANALQNLLTENAASLDPNFAFLYVWDGTAFKFFGNEPDATPLSLHPGQAFMVRFKDATETFTFYKWMQTHQISTAPLYRTTVFPKIIVNMSDGTQSKSTKISYYPEATSGLDIGYDAGAYQDGTPVFSINSHLINESEGLDFMVQSLPENSYESLVIPLSINAVANKELTFNADAINLQEGINIYLEDTLENTITRINETPYVVTVNEPLNGIGRFYLRTSETTLSTDDLATPTNVSIYKTTNANLRIVGLEEQVNANFKMYSILGKQVFVSSFNTKRVNDIVLPNLPTGIYLIHVISENEKQIKKIIME